MALVVEITNQSKLEKLKEMLGTKSESEIVDIALDVTFKELERKQKTSNGKLPEDYFEDLAAPENDLSDAGNGQAIANEDEEVEDYIDIDVHKLNRIPPKKSFKVKAHFKILGRGKPMKYDLSDYKFDEDE